MPSNMESFFLDDDEYLLLPSEAAQVDEADRKYPDDREFNEWFREFLRKKHIKPVNQRMARYWSSTSDSSDDTVKLALTLRAQQSIAKVMDRANNLHVKYATDKDGDSHWAGGHEVVISSEAAGDAKTLYEAIDNTSGITVHEVAHSKHTRRINGPLLDRYREKNEINNTLVNMMEDGRAEFLEMEDSPGFQTYLDKRVGYLWDKYGEKIVKAIPTYDKADYKLKMGAAIATTRMPNQMEGRLDPSWDEFITKVRELDQEYMDTGENMSSVKAIEFTDRLKKLMEITPQDEMKASGSEKEQVQALGNMLGHNDSGDKEMSEGMQQRVQALVDEEVEKLNPGDPGMYPEGNSPPDNIIVKKPTVVNPTDMPKVDNLLQKAKASFELRKAVPRADERLMKDGELDEDEVYRLLNGDMRVFRNIAEEVVPSAAVYFLVDMSGSMYAPFNGRGGLWEAQRTGVDDRLTVAQKLAFLLVKALEHRPNVTRRVLGHSTGSAAGWNNGGGAMFYRIWEEGDKLNRLSTIKSNGGGSNYDGFALAWAGKLIAEENAEQKLIIVLSDGLPSGGGRYGGALGMRHVRQVGDALARKGIDVVQLSMFSGLPEVDQKAMFKHYVPAPTGANPYGVMLDNMKRILEKVGRSG